MDQQRKTIQTLTVSLDGKRDELSVFYRQFGTKLYADSLDSDSRAGALSRERVETWRGLMSSRMSDTEAILGIKDAVTRRDELLRFRSEIDKTLTEERGIQNKRYEDLGRFFDRQYDAARDASVFGGVHAQASAEETVLSQLEAKQERLRDDLEASGFFGKMFAQFKLAGLASNIRLHKTRLSRIFANGGRSLFEGGGLDGLVSSGSAESDMVSLHANIRESASRLDEITRRSESLEGDLAAVRSALSAYAASDNPNRRMDELRSRVKETDRRIETLAILSAREYSDKFLDEDGHSILGDTGDGNSFSDMGAYAHELEQIALFRSSISEIRRRIEILETSLKIEAIDRNIASYERSRLDNERKIRHFQELNEGLAKSIDDAKLERAKLVARKADVEGPPPGDGNEPPAGETQPD